MEKVKTNCPRCYSRLEFPPDLGSVICSSCGSSFEVRHYEGAISLLPREGLGEDETRRIAEESAAHALIEGRLSELDELIAGANDNIEALRGREQSAPLHAGCAFFGLFTVIIIVIAIFMALGREYFGHWLFYLALAAVVILGAARIRRRLESTDQVDRFRDERLKLEQALEELERERERVLDLKQRLGSGRDDSHPDPE
ncbi:MAG TPA: hypothetical protein VIG62_12795 [Blastocatellia bacterium]|jgi:hypothetical protein